MCGAVRFEVREALGPATYCHCKRCQRRSGTAASANARVAPGSLAVLAGAEHVRCWEPAAGFAKCFCAVCGSALWSRASGSDEVWGVRLGAFDGDPGVTFSHRQWLASACAWEAVPDDGVPRYPEARPAAD